MITRRHAIAGALAMPILLQPALAFAQERVLRIAYTAVSHWAGAFTAQEEGFFAKRGIRAEFTLTPVSSQIPAVLLSRSADIGCLTPPTLFQAIDGGLPIVAVSGATVTSAEGEDSAQVVVAPGSGIGTPQDFVGRRVATPGFGSVLDIVFRAWLTQNGVDLSEVTFSETAMPNLQDVLRGGTVDAVVVANPFLERIVEAGIGEKIEFMRYAVPSGTMMTLYAASAGFVEEEPETIRAFQEAILEANAFIAAGGENTDRVRAHIAHYLNLPPDARGVLDAQLEAAIDEAQVSGWYDILESQQLVSTRKGRSEIVIPLPAEQ